MSGLALFERKAVDAVREHRFAEGVLSARAKGLNLVVDCCPKRRCNFNCAYCYVQRDLASRERNLNLRVLSLELYRLLALGQQGRLNECPCFRHVPAEMLNWRQITISGHGEPTLCPKFPDVLQCVLSVRSEKCFARCKLVLETNGSCLHLPHVRRALQLLAPEDEVWIKLDAGCQEHFARVNRSEVRFADVVENIRRLGCERPIVIQSLFPLIDQREPGAAEIDAYLRCLQDLKQRGARISLVQVFSANRPALDPRCRHLPLSKLSRIAQLVHDTTGLRAEVF